MLKIMFCSELRGATFEVVGWNMATVGCLAAAGTSVCGQLGLLTPIGQGQGGTSACVCMCVCLCLCVFAPAPVTLNSKLHAITDM